MEKETMDDRSFFSKIISDLKSERETEISHGADTIEISYPAISREDFKQNRMGILIFLFFFIFIMFFVANLLSIIMKEFTNSPEQIYSFLALFLPMTIFTLALPIILYRGLIRSLFMTEKLTLHPADFIYSHGIWGNFKEKLRVPKTDLISFSIGGNPSGSPIVVKGAMLGSIGNKKPPLCELLQEWEKEKKGNHGRARG